MRSVVQLQRSWIDIFCLIAKSISVRPPQPGVLMRLCIMRLASGQRMALWSWGQTDFVS